MKVSFGTFCLKQDSHLKLLDKSSQFRTSIRVISSERKQVNNNKNENQFQIFYFFRSKLYALPISKPSSQQSA